MDSGSNCAKLPTEESERSCGDGYIGAGVDCVLDWRGNWEEGENPSEEQEKETSALAPRLYFPRQPIPMRMHAHRPCPWNPSCPCHACHMLELGSFSALWALFHLGSSVCCASLCRVRACSLFSVGLRRRSKWLPSCFWGTWCLSCSNACTCSLTYSTH